MKHLLLLLLLCASFSGFAQISIVNNTAAASMAQMLAGPGVTVSNATFNNCYDSSHGKFYVTSSNIGMDSGIILCSGNASFAAGASNTLSFATPPNYGDPDLDILTTSAIRDACVLEFDFVPLGDTVRFNYVFGSMEYQSFTCTVFEDVFGFFASGPGITGPFSNNSINVAVVPGTVSCPVTINTINGSTASPCGTQSAPCTPPNNAYFFNNLPTGNTNTGVAYNGYTLPLVATIVTIPCSTYHLKLAISDAADQVLDTGVFIEAGSLSSNQYTVSSVTGLTDGTNPYIVEGCDTAIINIKRRLNAGVTPLADTVNLIVAGTAINGVDYPMIPSQVYFTANANDTLQQIVVAAFQDNISEPGPNFETVKIYITGGCGSLVTDSVSFQIRDSLYYTMTNQNVNICQGDVVNITGTFDPLIHFQWNPSTDVANDTLLLTQITPGSIGTQYYAVTGSYLTCPTVIKGFSITTDPVPSISPIPSQDVCQGLTVDISATVTPPFNYIINWLPANGLTNSGILNPTFTGTSTQTYTLTVRSPNANCSDAETTTVTVWPYTTGTVSNDTLVCNGTPVQLFATNTIGSNYLWFPAATLSCDNCPNPISTALGTTIYSVVLIEAHGCNDTLDILVENHPPFTLNLLNGDTSIYIGDTVHLNAPGAPFTFWTPTDYLSYASSSDPDAAPLEDITYYVTGLSTLNGCPQYDSVRIKVMLQDVFIPNAFSPNGDGKNDIFKPWARKLIKTHSFMVLDRWGHEVFSSNNIYNGWDGTTKGKANDPGVYMYYIKLEYPDGKVVVYKGDVTLLR